ncbi:MAG: hypothetical protein IPQ01_00480 [Zoogloea sp.]|nr:hypothetical protein [Zoogloea sp.]MBP7790629.1 hypothetical protein [Zoogloea sp.]
MSKIVQAVNSMIANDNYISSVLQGQSEIFFLYKGLYKWSITKRDDGYHLWFYPGGQELRSLAALDNDGWGSADIPMVHYHDAEIGTKEAKASFAELYTVLSEKVHGIDDVLNDIIGDGIPF